MKSDNQLRLMTQYFHFGLKYDLDRSTTYTAQIQPNQGLNF